MKIFFLLKIVAYIPFVPGVASLSDCLEENRSLYGVHTTLAPAVRLAAAGGTACLPGGEDTSYWQAGHNTGYSFTCKLRNIDNVGGFLVNF